MEITFISIHSLDDEARILYTSDSVIDILGYTPDELVNRPAWDFFPLEELPYARNFHQKGVSMDKAAVLAYCRIKDRDGQWVGCECCFTVVYDVMVVCTSIYKSGMRSDKRALEAPIVRRLFSSSPQDPRYHMLTHLSSKFSLASKEHEHEPRAALFLNRFTRTLTIMYATSGVHDIIGIPADVLRGRSFYYCIAENCLTDAVKCLENAKGNDSIAYLRFWFRDPRQDDGPEPLEESDEEMATDDSERGGNVDSTRSGLSASASSSAERSLSDGPDTAMEDAMPASRASSDESTHKGDTHESIFGQTLAVESSASSIGASPERQPQRPNYDQPIELEAVISCTSDGLVVCLRKARPMIPHPANRPSQPKYKDGLFAAPWAEDPVVPRVEERPGASFGTAFAPALGPQGAQHPYVPPLQTADGQSRGDFMSAIREQAVFAWALTGINGSLAEFAQGKPRGESVPENGFHVWASDPRQKGSGNDQNFG